MKKLVMIMLSALLIFAFSAGCGIQDPLNPGTTVPSDSEATETGKKEISDDDYEDSITGIYNYMVDLKMIDGGITPTEMSADLIGAEKGSKYSYSLNKAQVNVELYSYSENLNDTAKEILDSVKSNGSFQILGLDPVNAVISDSGKYLLIYSDTSVNSDNPDKNNVERRDGFINAFKSFKN